MLYSIIIPHKNSTELIVRLLDTIPKRTDIEVIVVDDCSDQDELLKLEEIQHIYLFELYHNTGKRGAGASRNVGLNHAKGKFIIFADSDDYFCDAFEAELDRVSTKDLDLVLYNVASVDSLTFEMAQRHVFFNNLVTDYLTTGKRDVLYKYSVPWGKIYRKNFIDRHNIRFAEVIAGNDMWFSCRCGILAGNYEISPAILYTVTVRAGSIVNTINTEYFMSRFNETIRVNNMLRKHKLSSYQYSVLYFVSNASKFGLLGYVLKEIIRNRSNIFIGFEKIFNYKQVLMDRENRRK